MTLTEAGVSLIKHFEGCRLTAYHDAVGVLTIGYGSTGDHVTEGMTISQAEADRLFVADVQCFAVEVRKSVVDLPDHQFSALVSLAYNIGIGAFRKSTLLRLIDDGCFWLAASQFERWNKAGGKVLPGLVRRREAERDMFCGFPVRWV